MQLARVIYPVETLGPGKRIAIWTAGCSKRCEKCINPELWNSNESREIAVLVLLKQIEQTAENNQVDGITITGGDPLEQKEALLELISNLHPVFQDILIYTGFTLDEINKEWDDLELETLHKNTGVLIDGRYSHELNDNLCPLRGSSNQEIHYFDESLQPTYEKYLCERGRCIQNFYGSTGLISVGIHNREEYINGATI